MEKAKKTSAVLNFLPVKLWLQLLISLYRVPKLVIAAYIFDSLLFDLWLLLFYYIAGSATGIPTPYTFLGDEAFPLKRWLMRPIPGASAKTHSQKVYNYRLSRARRTIENAFGILVARWRVLKRYADFEIIIVVMVAEIVLMVWVHFVLCLFINSTPRSRW